jgi:hypothetical protein
MGYNPFKDFANLLNQADGHPAPYPPQKITRKTTGVSYVAPKPAQRTQQQDMDWGAIHKQFVNIRKWGVPIEPRPAPAPKPSPRPKPTIMFHGTDNIVAAYQIFYEHKWRNIGENTPDSQPKGIWLTPSINYAKGKAKSSGAIIIVEVAPELIPELRKEDNDRYVHEITSKNPKPRIINGLTPIGILDGNGQRRLR